MSLVILAGLIYGIVCIVTQKASWRGMNYEGKRAVAAGQTIVLIFILCAIMIACVEIYGRR